MDRRIHIILTTFPSRPEAEQAARLVVQERLAVCAQVETGCRSFYRWQGDLQEAPEVTVRLKVCHDRLDACRGRLQALHPYETPMVLSWPAEWTDPGYLAWAYGEGRG